MPLPASDFGPQDRSKSSFSSGYSIKEGAVYDMVGYANLKKSFLMLQHYHRCDSFGGTFSLQYFMGNYIAAGKKTASTHDGVPQGEPLEVPPSLLEPRTPDTNHDRRVSVTITPPTTPKTGDRDSGTSSLSRHFASPPPGNLDEE